MLLHQASESFGAPLIVKGTFLQFQLCPVDRLRSQSAPASLDREGARCASKRTGAKKRDPRGSQEEDDEEALREGRALALQETWPLWSKRLLARAADKERRYVREHTMKLRVTLSVGGFVHVAKILGYSEGDIHILTHFAMIRVNERRNAVQIWCDDARLELPQMRALQVEAEMVRGLSRDFFFLHAGDCAAAVHYQPSMKVSVLKKRAHEMCGAPPSQQKLYLVESGEELKKGTLASANIRPGSCVRVCVKNDD